MDSNFKKYVRWQGWEYACFWAVAACLCLCYETGLCEEGILAGYPRLDYGLETLGILLTLGLIPLALKGFNRMLVRIRLLPLPESLPAYHRWGVVRMLLLAVVVWGNLWLYYATLNTIGAFCALIGLIASLFCFPGRQRMMNELNVDEA